MPEDKGRLFQRRYAGREFDRMAVQDQDGRPFEDVEEFLERMHMRVEGTASGERAEAEPVCTEPTDRPTRLAVSCQRCVGGIPALAGNPPLSPDGARISPLDGSTRFSRAVRR
jgi:hypothetical protein